MEAWMMEAWMMEDLILTLDSRAHFILELKITNN
jgi:hypothetical protein